MATPAVKMMLFKNSKSSPLHFLRCSLSDGSNRFPAQFLWKPAMFPQPQEQKPIFDLIGSKSSIAALDGSNSIIGVLNWRSSGFGGMDRMEARGERSYDDDDDDDNNEGGDVCVDMSDDDYDQDYSGESDGKYGSDDEDDCSKKY